MKLKSHDPLHSFGKFLVPWSQCTILQIYNRNKLISQAVNHFMITYLDMFLYRDVLKVHPTFTSTDSNILILATNSSTGNILTNLFCTEIITMKNRLQTFLIMTCHYIKWQSKLWKRMMATRT